MTTPRIPQGRPPLRVDITASAESVEPTPVNPRDALTPPATSHVASVDGVESARDHAPRTQRNQRNQRNPVLGGDARVPQPQPVGELRATSLVELRARAEDDSLDVVFQKHLADFRTALAELRRQAPSVAFFGGARLTPADPYYKLAQAFGASLVPRGIPPKTGAGPGAMHAVPSEFVATRDSSVRASAVVAQSVIDGASRLADLSDQRTQGFNIKLPAEQKISPAIEQAQEIQQFAYRKFALYENVRGLVVFPGGFGTLDELLEVLVLKREGHTRDPIVLAGPDFWLPILDAWRNAARRHGADLVGDLLDDIFVTDDPEAALDFITSHECARAFEDEPEELYVRMVRELKLARYVAMRQEPAITFIGGDKLHPSDPALSVARELAARIDDAGVPMRVGQDGQVKAAIEDVTAQFQQVLWTDDAHLPRSQKPDVNTVKFRERIPHKEVLLRNSTAYVVLPCAERGKDELCSVLCQIQTGKLPKRPLVLVDEGFWRPIVDAWKEQMLGDAHGYIEPEDLELVTFANTADDACRALNEVLVPQKDR